MVSGYQQFPPRENGKKKNYLRYLDMKMQVQDGSISMG